MDRPLWRIFLNVAFLGLAAQRGAAATMLHLSDASGLLIAMVACQCLGALLVAVAILTGRGVDACLIALATTVVATSIAEIALRGPSAAPAALAQATLAVLAAIGLRYFVRRAASDER